MSTNPVIDYARCPIEDFVTEVGLAFHSHGWKGAHALMTQAINQMERDDSVSIRIEPTYGDDNRYAIADLYFTALVGKFMIQAVFSIEKDGIVRNVLRCKLKQGDLVAKTREQYFAGPLNEAYAVLREARQQMVVDLLFELGSRSDAAHIIAEALVANDKSIHAIVTRVDTSDSDDRITGDEIAKTFDLVREEGLSAMDALSRDTDMAVPNHACKSKYGSSELVR